MKLKTRTLIQTLSTSLVCTLILSLIFFLAIAGIRNTVLSNSGELGSSAAGISALALDEQAAEQITRIARDTALLLDEKIIKIENHTRMTADIAGAIYSHKEAYRPQSLPLVPSGSITPSGPYLHVAPGTDIARIRGEAELAGNIAGVLRQITVIDRGITTSTIGGESGYIIAMDAYPWPQTDFDPRRYSWYRGAKERGGLFWTDVYADLRGRGPAISCAMPFYDQSGGTKRFRGVARSTVMLTDFSKIIDSARFGRSGSLFLLDQNGLKLFSSGSVDVQADGDGGVSGENYLESEDAALRSLGMSMTGGAPGMTSLTLNNIPVYAAYAPIATLGWSLGVAIPVQEIREPSLQIEERIRVLTGIARSRMDRRILLLSGVIGLLLLASQGAIALLSLRFTAGITGPILALTDVVREVSGGNLEREVRVNTGDELEQLASSFNTMTVKLREHIDAVSKATADKQRIDTELDIARRIQMSMLPNAAIPPAFPGKSFSPEKPGKNSFDLFAAVHPAKEVGGDFYDFFFIDQTHLALIIADVSGKGIPAALFMAITKTLIKNQLQSGKAAELALNTINRQLCDNNIAEMFVTLWLGVLDTASGRLSYVNAGHNPPLIKREGSGSAFLVSPPDLVLAGMDDTLYHLRETVLAPGDLLFLYTDGITEAIGCTEAVGFNEADSPAGAMYGKERLRDFLDTHAEQPLQVLLPRLYAEIEQFSGIAVQADDLAVQADDITMLAFRIDTPAYRRRGRILSAKTEHLAEQLQELTGFTGRELEAAQCPAKTRGQIELAAEEIFVNIARYAYTGASPADTRTVTIQCETKQDAEQTRLILSFSDRGEPFNPLERADPDLSLPLEQREAGGLGILLVKRTMDTIRYSYDDGMNSLVIEKYWRTAETGKEAT
jgi:sigma-B regulation protein RsbU (phosphoserine phosphatase)